MAPGLPGERQPRRSGADDKHLRSHRRHGRSGAVKRSALYADFARFVRTARQARRHALRIVAGRRDLSRGGRRGRRMSWVRQATLVGFRPQEGGYRPISLGVAHRRRDQLSFLENGVSGPRGRPFPRKSMPRRKPSRSPGKFVDRFKWPYTLWVAPALQIVCEGESLTGKRLRLRSMETFAGFTRRLVAIPQPGDSLLDPNARNSVARWGAGRTDVVRPAQTPARPCRPAKVRFIPLLQRPGEILDAFRPQEGENRPRSIMAPGIRGQNERGNTQTLAGCTRE